MSYSIFWAVTQRMLSIVYPRFGKAYRTLEDASDTLSRNVCKQMPKYAAQHTRTGKISSTPLRKPEI
jgi:hypothetical protein